MKHASGNPRADEELNSHLDDLVSTKENRDKLHSVLDRVYECNLTERREVEKVRQVLSDELGIRFEAAKYHGVYTIANTIELLEGALDEVEAGNIKFDRKSTEGLYVREELQNNPRVHRLEMLRRIFSNLDEKLFEEIPFIETDIGEDPPYQIEEFGELSLEDYSDDELGNYDLDEINEVVFRHADFDEWDEGDVGVDSYGANYVTTLIIKLSEDGNSIEYEFKGDDFDPGDKKIVESCIKKKAWFASMPAIDINKH